MLLTRTEFDAACKALISANSTIIVSGSPETTQYLKHYPTNWTWHEHNSYPGLGYLSRSVQLSASCSSTGILDEVDFEEATIEEDDASLSAQSIHVPGASLYCQQFVVHSATFQVPVFYFIVHKSDGEIMSLADIMSTSLFRPRALPDPQHGHGIDVPGSAFALLSQGDHPTLGIPCWYLHPCHTADIVGEILDELVTDKRQRSQRYLEAWFMVLSNMINWD